MEQIRRIALVATVIGLGLIAVIAALGGPVPGGTAVAGLTEAATPTQPSPPPGNHPPVSQDADVVAYSGFTVNISFQAHDADFCGGGQQFSISILTLPEHGELANQGWPGSCQDQPENGYALLITTFDYTSEPGFQGTDTVTFTYRDGYWAQTGNVATVTMHVQAGEGFTPTPKPPTPTPTSDPTPTDPPPTGEPAPTLVGFTPTPVGDPTPTPAGTFTPAPSSATPTPTTTPPGQATPPVQTPVPTTVGPMPTPTPTPPLDGQTPVPTPTPTPLPAGPVLGNWDCDNSVSSIDALKELRFVAALSVSQHEPCPDLGTEMSSAWGDVDCNGDITSVDALKILRHVAGLPVSQTEPCADIGGLLY